MSEKPTNNPHLLQLAFLCEAASESGSHLNALGIGVNLITAAQLPAIHNFTLVLRLGWMGGEVPPGPKDLLVRVLGPDHARVAEMAGAFGSEGSANVHPELPVGANLVLPMPLPLTQYGLYQVEITIEERSYNPLLFKVVPPTAEP